MANVFDFLGPRWRAPGPWDKHPAPNWHRRPARRASVARAISFVIGAFALGGFIALAAPNYERGSLEALFAPESPQAAREPSRPAPSPVRYTAVDGDSLRNGSDNIRLVGIDAPELNQACRDASGRGWACGRAARERLSKLVSRGVHCVSDGRDRYGRTLARCSAGSGDIGEAMVREGLALDFMGGGYGTAEREAREAKRGIWSGDFVAPQEHRRRYSPRAER